MTAASEETRSFISLCSNMIILFCISAQLTNEAEHQMPWLTGCHAYFYIGGVAFIS
jgi:hypothetical protein